MAACVITTISIDCVDSGAAARLVEVQEMVMGDAASFRWPGSVQLLERPMGINTVGVVAWLLLLRTPECPQGRQVNIHMLQCNMQIVAQLLGFSNGSLLAGHMEVFSVMHQCVLGAMHGRSQFEQV